MAEVISIVGLYRWSKHMFNPAFRGCQNPINGLCVCCWFCYRCGCTFCCCVYIIRCTYIYSECGLCENTLPKGCQLAWLMPPDWLPTNDWQYWLFFIFIVLRRLTESLDSLSSNPCCLLISSNRAICQFYNFDLIFPYIFIFENSFVLLNLFNKTMQ